MPHEVILEGRAAIAALPFLTIYLAGPMRGLPLYNFPAFARSAAWLRTRGATVICPAEMDLALGFDPSRDAASHGFDEDAAIARDLDAIARADAVVFLPGWTESRGAMTEYDLADALGLRMFALDLTETTDRRLVEFREHR